MDLNDGGEIKMKELDDVFKERGVELSKQQLNDLFL